MLVLDAEAASPVVKPRRERTHHVDKASGAGREADKKDDDDDLGIVQPEFGF